MENLKDLLKNKMITIADGLTVEDKEDGIKNIPLSQPTLYRYLKGEVKKIEIAQLIVDFYQKRIEERINNLKSLR